MVKLIACDLDGTLLPRGQRRLSAELENKIKSVLANKKNFAIISGRDYSSIRRVVDFKTEDIYYICCGGSVCIKNGKVLYSKPVSSLAVIAAIKASKESKKGLVLSSDKVVYVYGEASFVRSIKNMYGEDAVEIRCNRGVVSPVYKISFYGETEQKLLEGKVSGLKLFYNRNGWEEYVSAISGKMEAFSDLRMRVGVLASETVAAGDDLCDVPMLQKAGKAFALTPEAAIQAKAEYITDPIKIFEFSE